MWIFILEAALALGLLLFIVWWTLAPVQKRERGRDAGRDAGRESQSPVSREHKE